MRRVSLPGRPILPALLMLILPFFAASDAHPGSAQSHFSVGAIVVATCTARGTTVVCVGHVTPKPTITASPPQGETFQEPGVGWTSREHGQAGFITITVNF
ncbi:MAG TPA: hypothetical protein VJA45_11735 [Methylomirabilota bacterium]|nr:hypothetical protein [Methylomirabilota bacterium]